MGTEYLAREALKSPQKDIDDCLTEKLCRKDNKSNQTMQCLFIEGPLFDLYTSVNHQSMIATKQMIVISSSYQKYCSQTRLRQIHTEITNDLRAWQNFVRID